jgi:hypothetical protein
MQYQPKNFFPYVLFLSCLLIESFYQITQKFIVAGLYTLANFNDYRMTYLGVLGCVDVVKQPLVQLPFKLYELLLIVFAFIISKQTTNRYRLLVGAWLFYSFYHAL